LFARNSFTGGVFVFVGVFVGVGMIMHVGAMLVCIVGSLV